MMYFYKFFVGLSLYVISTVGFAHVAGITDTAINLKANSVNLVYTLPVDNINEFSDEQKSMLENTIIQGFFVQNKTTSQTTMQTKVCNGKLISRNKLENIQSEQFRITYTCDQPLANLAISYSLLFDKDESHKNHVRLSMAGRSQGFTYSTAKKTHILPVNDLLAAWKVSLSPNKPLTSLAISSQNKNLNNSTSFTELLLQSTHYFLIGVEHILLGYDHVLFLIALLLLPLGFRSIVIIATSFTIAHSITLALSVFEVFTLPAPYVEAVIALSIVYIAIDNIRTLQSDETKPINNTRTLVPWKRRSLITFLFGLLHGFGFSYVLKEIGLGEHIAGSLLFFNLGVELGQLLIIAVCFPILWYAFRKVWGKKLAITLSALVGLMGVFWLIERVFSFI